MSIEFSSPLRFALIALVLLTLGLGNSARADDRLGDRADDRVTGVLIGPTGNWAADWPKLIRQPGVDELRDSELFQPLPDAYTTAQTGAVQRFRLQNTNRYQLGGGTRLTGWRMADDFYFGRTKGDLSGVALIWQRSLDQQISLSDQGLKLTRRLR